MVLLDKRKIYSIGILIIISVIMSFFVWENVIKVSQTTYIDGIYINQEYGYHSDIIVKVIIENQRIYSIEVLEHEEPEILANVVFSELPVKMIKYNTAQVDIVSGASYTSKSLINAVEKALEEAVESNNPSNGRD